jgi:hypothetical protein
MVIASFSSFAKHNLITDKRVLSFFVNNNFGLGGGSVVWSYHKDILDVKAEKTFIDKIFNTTTIIFICSQGPYVTQIVFWRAQTFVANLLKSRKVFFTGLRVSDEEVEKIKEIILQLKGAQSSTSLPEPQVPAFYKAPSAKGIFKSIIIGIAIFILILGAIVGIGFLIK